MGDQVGSAPFGGVRTFFKNSKNDTLKNIFAVRPYFNTNT